MTDQAREKLKRFLADPVMSQVVYDELLRAFLEPKPQASTEEKAASFIAIERLQAGWKKLERESKADTPQAKPLEQVGL